MEKETIRTIMWLFVAIMIISVLLAILYLYAGKIFEVVI
jgi:hypothetical protein